MTLEQNIYMVSAISMLSFRIFMIQKKLPQPRNIKLIKADKHLRDPLHPPPPPLPISQATFIAESHKLLPPPTTYTHMHSDFTPSPTLTYSVCTCTRIKSPPSKHKNQTQAHFPSPFIQSDFPSHFEPACPSSHPNIHPFIHSCSHPLIVRACPLY